MTKYEYAVEQDDRNNGLSEFLLFTKNKPKAFNMLNKQTWPSHYVIYKIEAGKRDIENIFFSKVLKIKEIK